MCPPRTAVARARRRALQSVAPVVVVALVALVALAAGAPFAPRPAAADGGTWGRPVPGEFIVELVPGTNADALNAVVGGIAPPERLVLSDSIFRFRLPVGTDPRAGVERFLTTPGVSDAQPNLVSEVSEFYGGRRMFWSDWEPADPTAPRAAYALAQPGLGSAGLPAPGAGGAGVTVAVLDTGVALKHRAFTGHIAPFAVDVVDRDFAPFEVANRVDDNRNGLVDEAFGHGTFVAGLVRLVAPGAAILPVRVIDTDGVTNAWRILQGLEWSRAAGADVVNLSLGGDWLGAIVARRFEVAADAGVLLVAAAGNEGVSDLRYPAAFDGVLGVTAIDGRTGATATFANTGSWIDVAAPGVRLVSAYPNGRYATWGGTSAAAPVAAGALALVREILPAAPVDDVVDTLTSTAEASGLANVSAYGRIDVAAAVTRALLR